MDSAQSTSTLAAGRSLGSGCSSNSHSSRAFVHHSPSATWQQPSQVWADTSCPSRKLYAASSVSGCPILCGHIRSVVRHRIADPSLTLKERRAPAWAKALRV